MSNHQDVFIIGAGLSGIGAAYYLQKHCPGMSYAILEARESIGGTWDLFRYPGIRSDSDMYTLGHGFHPWKESQAIADGPAILKYIREMADKFDIKSRILFKHKIIKANWSSQENLWIVALESGKEMTCRFLFMCSGYYNYEQGYLPQFKGREQFSGAFIHPQHWPENLDYKNKKVLVIGSGATAVTLVPELAKDAKEVIMLQRSPTYVINLPRIDAAAQTIKKFLPTKFAHTVIRSKNIAISMAFYQFCRRCPNAARKFILKQIEYFFPNDTEMMKNFSPSYQPWDQRLCFVPDNDLFLALQSKKARIVTDEIDHVIKTGVVLKSGQTLEADIVVAATGLEIKFLAGIEMSIDGRVLDLCHSIPYKGTMLSDVPNFAMSFGYINASWTLKCGFICEWVARLLAHMHKHHYKRVVPVASPDMSTTELIGLHSGYLLRAKSQMPKQGVHSPWQTHQNYFLDYWEFKLKPLTDRALKFH